ncbi:hypothetical protein Hanom_Chr11g00973251 [Helianthus anomalus]
MKMTRFHTFWIQMRKNKHLDESRKTGQTSGTKMAFYSIINLFITVFGKSQEKNINLFIIVFGKPQENAVYYSLFT